MAGPLAPKTHLLGEPRKEESRAQVVGHRQTLPYRRVVGGDHSCPLAPQPGSKRLAEAGGLLATIHVAGLSCPQVAGKHQAPSSPSLPVPYLPPQRETCCKLPGPPTVATGAGGTSSKDGQG